MIDGDLATLKKKYDGIIFDLDGTLYDKHRLSFFLTLVSIKSIPYLINSRKTLKALEGSFFNHETAFRNEYYNLMASKSRVSVESVIKWEQKTFYPSFVKILKRFKGRPGVNSLLEQLELPCAVLSDYDCVAERLDSLKIDPNHFKLKLYSGSLGGLKPSVELFLKTAEMMRLNPHNTLVVGDKENKDGEGARQAGMDYFHVTTSTWPLLIKKLKGIK